jgi:hypothetical protein
MFWLTGECSREPSCYYDRWCNGYYAYLKCGRSWGESQSGQTKDYEIGICCFSDKHAASMSKSKDWLAQNNNDVSK